MYTAKVVTLWFRCPELLYGQRNYTLAVDCWSLGCIFAELILSKGRALFNGEKENLQIQLIYDICGITNEQDWPGVSKLRFFE
jgi:serine/threonine protein kinase